jgi:tRNA pseudouridine55 synthase
VRYKEIAKCNDIVSFAGRLDPMAEGVMVLLVGENANAHRREFEHFDKIYTVEMACGISTDTGDLLGIPVVSHERINVDGQRIQNVANGFEGVFDQRYHPYSSKRVHGKPLFAWAKNGMIDQIELPVHPIHIRHISVKEKGCVSIASLQKEVSTIVPSVRGDFRQVDIVTEWCKLTTEGHFQSFELHVDCGKGGAYMRVLVEDIAKKCAIRAVARHIVRTRVGQWTITEAMPLWP